jgi:Fe-S-cluster containining protein
MECRIGCGACCIAPSISSSIPGMPEGKAAGIRCINLDELNRCLLWGRPNFPEICKNFQPVRWVCGDSNGEALQRLTELETLTTP